MIEMEKQAYLNLVTYRNSTKEKYMKFVDMILEYPISLGAVTDSFLFAFDLENAAGVNLDTIGALVGVDRLLPYRPSLDYSRLLDDDEYRTMIRLKIARNVWDGRNEEVESIYRRLFPDLNVEYTDNQDCTIKLKFSGNTYSRETELLMNSGSMLVPAGVRANVEVEGGTINNAIYIGSEIGSMLISEELIATYNTWGSLKRRRWRWGELTGITWGSLKATESIRNLDLEAGTYTASNGAVPSASADAKSIRCKYTIPMETFSKIALRTTGGSYTFHKIYMLDANGKRRATQTSGTEIVSNSAYDSLVFTVRRTDSEDMAAADLDGVTSEMTVFWSF